MNKAFIFTMDAVMALIPIFIITASMSQISGVDSLVSHGSLLNNEKIAQSTLEVMSIRGETEGTNRTDLNNTLKELLPDYLNYAYELEYNGSTILNVTNGNVSLARNVMVAHRFDYIKIYALLGIVSRVSHGGTPASGELCPRDGMQPPIYETYFDLGAGDTTTFDFWLEGVATSPTPAVRAWYYITNQSVGCAYLRGGVWTSFMNANDEVAKVQVDGELQEGVTNYLYIKISANPNRSGSFYVIRAPQDADEGLISYDNAVRRNFAWITLKVWQ